MIDLIGDPRELENSRRAERIKLGPLPPAEVERRQRVFEELLGNLTKHRVKPGIYSPFEEEMGND